MMNHIVGGRYTKRRYLKYAKPHDYNAGAKLLRLLTILLGLLLVHALGMMYFENLSLGDALWLSITTVTTVGYGDLSAATWQGRLITTIAIYIIAISILAQLAAEFFEYRLQVRDDKVKGNWAWSDMKDHILIINTPDEDTNTYLTRLIDQIRCTPEFKDMPIQILSHKFPDGLPVEMAQNGVVHYNGVAEDSDNLANVNVHSAKYIVILAKNSGDPISDSLTFDVLSRIKEIGTKALVAAECSVDVNRSRLMKAGASIIIRPIRAYPELLVRSLSDPGTEKVLEDLFTHDDDHMVRLDVQFDDLVWRDILIRFIYNDYGLPMGFIDGGGVHANPNPDTVCSGTGLITLVREDQRASSDEIERELKAIKSKS